MIGGMISSSLLTLIVIPAIFALVKGFRLPNADRIDDQPPPVSASGSMEPTSETLEPAK
jgi:copper/silver efflux system protein